MKKAIATILVIDDDAAVRQSLQEILGLEGFEVTTAADGARGLALLKERAVDLVLTDLAMPGVDGMAVLKFTSTLMSGETRPSASFMLKRFPEP